AGFDGVNTRGDVWEVGLAPLTGKELQPSGTIGIRESACMNYDPVRDRVLLIGGNGGSAVSALNLSPSLAWAGIATQRTPPPGRSYACSVYDPYGDRLLVCGGFDG